VSKDGQVAKGFKPVDRDQVFLLPPDMRDWLPEEHLVWFLLDVVDSFDLAAFRPAYRLGGAGREAFDPRMMVALLAYGYCNAVRSSRAIERGCHTDVAFRVVCAQHVPDHSVIARFRASHADALADLFAQVLTVCAEAGLGRVGVVAIDGTKIAANASLDVNRKEEWFRAQAQAMVDEAAAVDAVEDAAAAEQAATGDGPGDRLSPRWRDRSGRRERIKAALEEIEAYQGEQDKPVAEAERQAEAAREAYELAKVERAAKIADSQAASAAGRPRRGRPVDPDREPHVLAEARRRAERAAERAEKLRTTRDQAKPRRVNATDPQSRVMKTRQGWIQGYNNQTAVSEDGLILAVRTTSDPVDMHQLVPMMDAAAQAVAAMGATAGEPDRTIGTVLADAGYFSEANLEAEGPDRLIAAGKKHNLPADPAESQRHPSDPRRQTCHTMLERLRQPESVELYRRRAAIVEPVNGHLKDRRGLRRFSRRGLPAAATEFTFTAWVTNLMKLHTAHLVTA
jgi:transposase